MSQISFRACGRDAQETTNDRRRAADAQLTMARFSKLERQKRLNGPDAPGQPSGMWPLSLALPSITPGGHFGKRIASLRGLFLIISVVVVLIWGGLGVFAYQTYHAGEYPGATPIDASDIVRASPSLFFKRVEASRSTDPFNRIYNWYSQRFDLGPERYANGNCLLMARSSTLIGPVNLTASVMVCDTKADRMMFVTRTYLLRYPDWVRRLL